MEQQKYLRITFPLYPSGLLIAASQSDDDPAELGLPSQHSMALGS